MAATICAAASETLGAIITSTNWRETIASAVSASSSRLKAIIPPKAEVGSVLASDAFFPFRDGLDAAAAAGITAVIQPGGSMRDDEVIAAADEHNIAMVFTGMRHFRH